MTATRPDRVIDPVCGMSVVVATAEAEGLNLEHDGRTFAFCGAGCRRAFDSDPEGYAAKAAAAESEPQHGVGLAMPAIDDGMRRWYESCSCCLSDAYPEIKAALDAERQAQSASLVPPGICEVAEATQELAAR